MTRTPFFVTGNESKRRTAAICGFGKAATRFGALVVAQLLAFAAVAEPIHLKLAFYESRDTAVYLYGIKPFVDSVNADGLLAIDVHADGALGRGLAEQPRLVLDGTADIAFVIPGQTPYRFPDNRLLELPGLFRNLGEGTLAYTRLVAAGKLRGYENYFVIGAYTTGANTIHSRRPIDSLGALKGQRIRANNQIEAAVLEGLGATPTVLPVPQIGDTIRKGGIDGAALAPTALIDYHIAPLTPHHFLLQSGVNPFALVMNRKKLDSLPQQAQALIRKYSGDRAAAIWIDSYGRNEHDIFEAIRSKSGQTIVEPSPQDAEAGHRVFETIIAAWAAENARNGELLRDVRTELKALRAPK
jgi:TRAP-type C4-dicarboxylate transport system substrate-binding protein